MIIRVCLLKRQQDGNANMISIAIYTNGLKIRIIWSEMFNARYRLFDNGGEIKADVI